MARIGLWSWRGHWCLLILLLRCLSLGSVADKLDGESLDVVVAVFCALLVCPFITLIGALDIDRLALYKILVDSGVTPEFDSVPSLFLTDGSILLFEALGSGE